MGEPNKEKTFPVKYMKKIVEIPDFVDGTNSLDTDEIKKKILETEGNLYEIDNAKEEDDELMKAKEKAKEFAQPYRDSKALETAKLKYFLYILETRGINL